MIETTAQREIARLERAEMRSREADARRVLRDERCELMARLEGFRCGRRSAAELSDRIHQAARVREMWQ